VNPWGRVKDLYPREGQVAELMHARQIIEAGDFEYAFMGRDTLILRNATRSAVLSVLTTTGGNQFNVYKNLFTFRQFYPNTDLNVEAHYSGGRENMDRVNLHMPGDWRVVLKEPELRENHVFDGVQKSLMISSSEPDSENSVQWKWLRDLAQQGTRFYWNPGRKQIAGGLTDATRTAFEDAVEMCQFNHAEALEWMRNYEDLPRAKWTIITHDSGASIKVEGGTWQEVPRVYVPNVEEMLGGRFSPHPVGIGDAYFAGLIAKREVNPGVQPREAGDFAGHFAGLQASHRGSNLFSVRRELDRYKRQMPRL
jgi:hypothetical protein